MICPGCLKDDYLYDGYCAGCGSYNDYLYLPELLGIKLIDGVRKIVPLTFAIVKRKKVFYQREVTR